MSLGLVSGKEGRKANKIDLHFSVFINGCGSMCTVSLHRNTLLVTLSCYQEMTCSLTPGGFCYIFVFMALDV